MDIFERMRRDFERMIASDIPGQNWECDLIADIGNGYPGTGHSVNTRCVCFSKDGRQEEPTIRTMLSDGIRRGDMVYITDYDGGTFYLLEAVPQKQPNCYTAKGSRCNAFVTVKESIPPTTDEYGYTITEATEREIVRHIPAVIRHSQTINSGTGAAGMFFADELTLTMQLNDFTAALPVEAYFDLDGTRYIITDRITDGATRGTITYTAQRQAGSRMGG